MLTSIWCRQQYDGISPQRSDTETPQNAETTQDSSRVPRVTDVPRPSSAKPPRAPQRQCHSAAVAGQSQPCFRSLQAASSGSLVALFTPSGELIVAQRCGNAESQRWLLATVQAPAQDDVPLGGATFS